jgi:hypothetical protein
MQGLAVRHRGARTIRNSCSIRGAGRGCAATMWASSQQRWGPPFRSTQSVPASGGPQEVKIERRGDTYRVPVRINDTITLPFLLDTGATDLVIPADVALTLIRAGALRSGDFVGKDRYRLANSSEEVSDLVVLHEVQVGEHIVRNVTPSISPPQGEPASRPELSVEIRYCDPRLQPAGPHPVALITVLFARRADRRE